MLLGGSFFTLRERLGGGYWLATSLGLVAFLLFIHLVGFSSRAAETPSVIAMSHHDNLRAVLALIVLSGLVAVLLVLAWLAFNARRRSGRC